MRENTKSEYELIYDKIEEMYINGKSIPMACQDLKISVRKYYTICKILNKDSITYKKIERYNRIINTTTNGEWVECSI